MPLRILSRPTSIRRFLVSSFLAEVIQQIHSLRASDEISAHTIFAAVSDAIASPKSSGMRCTAPGAFFVLALNEHLTILSGSDILRIIKYLEIE